MSKGTKLYQNYRKCQNTQNYIKITEMSKYHIDIKYQNYIKITENVKIPSSFCLREESFDHSHI